MQIKKEWTEPTDTDSRAVARDGEHTEAHIVSTYNYRDPVPTMNADRLPQYTYANFMNENDHDQVIFYHESTQAIPTAQDNNTTAIITTTTTTRTTTTADTSKNTLTATTADNPLQPHRNRLHITHHLPPPLARLVHFSNTATTTTLTTTTTNSTDNAHNTPPVPQPHLQPPADAIYASKLPYTPSVVREGELPELVHLAYWSSRQKRCYHYYASCKQYANRKRAASYITRSEAESKPELSACKYCVSHFGSKLAYPNMFT
jgi:hypothetical protein